VAVPIDIPESLTRAVGYNDEGVAWLKRLPELLTACAKRWELLVEVPMVEDYAVMSYNYITLFSSSSQFSERGTPRIKRSNNCVFNSSSLSNNLTAPLPP